MDTFQESFTAIASKYLETIFRYGFNKYGDLLFGITIGLSIALAYHKLVGLRALKKSHQYILDEKDELILTLRILVLERLDRVTTRQKDKSFLDKVKNFFNSKY